MPYGVAANVGPVSRQEDSTLDLRFKFFGRPPGGHPGCGPTEEAVGLTREIRLLTVENRPVFKLERWNAPERAGTRRNARISERVPG